MTEILLISAGLVSPLVFFTDLTRNPFCFQQVLLSLCVLAAALWLIIRSIKQGEPAFPRTAADKAVFLLFAVCAISFLASYFSHVPFYRPAMLNSLRNEFLFLACVCVPVYYLSAGQKNGSFVSEKKSCAMLLIFIFVWVILWLLYPFLKNAAPSETIFGKIFDPYGTFLFIIAFFALRPVVRGGGRKDFFRLILATGIISSLYGIFQFFGGEAIWPKILNPYGNRPVSTFGNPNFLSSFAAMILPYAFFRLLFALSLPEKLFYGIASLSYAGVLVCSMARSSWIGAATALVFMLISLKMISARNKEYSKIFPDKKYLMKILLPVLLLAAVFPSSSSDFRPLIASRTADLFSGLSVSFSRSVPKKTDANEALSAGQHAVPYGEKKINVSVYQRLIMWAGAWQMGLENPILGKGFGQFELFNTFYQGRLLASFPALKGIRTHANEAHNEIAQIWAETGIAGLGASVLLAFVFLRLFHNKFKTECEMFSPESELQADRLSFIPIAAGMIAMAADNMMNVSLHFAMPAAMFCWLAGSFMAETGGLKPGLLFSRNFICPFPLKIAVSVPFAALFVFLCMLQYRIFMREISYFAGYKAFRERRPAYAAALMEKAVSFDAGNVNVSYELANIRIKLADMPQAEKYLRKALLANAGYDEIFSNLAAVLSKQGKNEEALPLMRIATLINPVSANSWNTLGSIYSDIPVSENMLASALADFAEAEKMYPEEAAYPNMSGYMYMKAEKYAEAASVLASAVRKHPENKALCENFLLASSKSGTENGTRQWLKEYYRLSGILGSFLDNAPRSETEKAFEDLEKLIESSPGDFRLFELKAKFLFKMKKYDGAVQEMQKVLDYVPDDADVRYGLAVIYETAGNKKKALAELGAVLDRHPDNPRAAYRKKKLEDI